MKILLFLLVLPVFCFGQDYFSTNQNKYTRNLIEYAEVKTDLQGKPFPASFVPDGVLHVKKNGKIYRAQPIMPNTFKAEWFGIKPANSDNSAAMEQFIKLFPKFFPVELRFEIGRYNFSKPITIERLPIRLIGVNAGGWQGYTTEFYFNTGDGFNMYGCVNAHLENIHIRGNGKGRGLLLASQMTMRNVWVTHFKKGVEIYGDLYNGNGYDASRGVYHKLTIAVCHTGLRLVGGDANQNTFYDLDIRDIDSVGLLENSFLGNTFYSPHFNNCKGGALQVTDPNSIVSFYDCYMEDGMPNSVVTKNTSFFGARTFETQITGGWQQRGIFANQMIIGTVGLQEGGIQLLNKYGGSWNLVPNKDGLWEFNYSNLNHTKQYLLPPGFKWKNNTITVPSIGNEYPHKISPIQK